MGKQKGRNDVADLSRLNPLDSKAKDILRVVIETPKGSRNKFAFDPDQHVFELKKVPPTGMAFPTTSDSCLLRKRMTVTRSTCSS